MHRIALALALVLLAGLGTRASADVDVSSVPYLDVLETSDGSIWKGVVIEQVPNVHYKIATSDGSIHVIRAHDVVKLTKQDNPAYSGGGAARHARDRDDVRLDPRASREPPPDPEHGAGQPPDEPGGWLPPDPEHGVGLLPPPFAHSGLRVAADSDVIIPTGALGDVGFLTSFAPSLRLGYEWLIGNIGIAGGVQTRFTYWRLPGETDDSAWLFEAHVYGRAALHVGRAAPYVGVSLGADLNHLYSAADDMSETSFGFGMNLQFGLAVAAWRNVAVEIGGDYHPGTDTLSDATDKSAAYFALRFGSELRF